MIEMVELTDVLDKVASSCFTVDFGLAVNANHR
jgi:hypothetical protein